MAQLDQNQEGEMGERASLHRATGPASMHFPLGSNSSAALAAIDSRIVNESHKDKSIKSLQQAPDDGGKLCKAVLTTQITQTEQDRKFASFIYGVY